MTNQHNNRFLMPTAGHQQQHRQLGAASSSEISSATSITTATTNSSNSAVKDPATVSVDDDFDAFWEEEARNPHRNRIRIGRQYQATVPPLLKPGERDKRKSEELEILSFCPKKSAQISDNELDHYFTVAKSLNLFASLVETRCLLGRDVTIADLNHIRHKEGLSLASVIQPLRQQQQSSVSSSSSSNIAINGSNLPNLSPTSSTQQNQASSTSYTPTVSTTTLDANNADSSVVNSTWQNQHATSTSTDMIGSETDQQHTSANTTTASSSVACASLNQPLMKALSHFISLHHPCYHEPDCKKMQKDLPVEDYVSGSSIIPKSGASASSSSVKETKPGRSRSSVKQQQQQQTSKDEDHATDTDNTNSPQYDNWTQEEIELFSKATEICGKNFNSIKREFLPSKSVRSILEYYYIGSREVSDNKKKPNQHTDVPYEACSSSEKNTANNNNSQGGSGDGNGSSSTTGKANSSSSTGLSATSSSRASSTSNRSSNTHSSESGNSSKADDFKLESSKRGHEILDYKSKPKTIDPRMSVYNFDDFKEDSPVKTDPSLPGVGTEVKPLKAKPIVPNASIDIKAANSNLGSLKFFMDGQLVLKLNACQEQQQEGEKCHWVQSEKVGHGQTQKVKKYTKRSSSCKPSNCDGVTQNGSRSNSIVSSYQDEDDSKQDDMSADEDSKDSVSPLTNLPQPPIVQTPNTMKRPKIKIEANQQNQQQQHHQLPSTIGINYMSTSPSTNRDISMPNMSDPMSWLNPGNLAAAAALLFSQGNPSNGLNMPPSRSNQPETLPPINMASSNIGSNPIDLSFDQQSANKLPKKVGSDTPTRSRAKSKKTFE